jgi:hypothetical protein
MQHKELAPAAGKRAKMRKTGVQTRQHRMYVSKANGGQSGYYNLDTGIHVEVCHDTRIHIEVCHDTRLYVEVCHHDT